MNSCCDSTELCMVLRKLSLYYDAIACYDKMTKTNYENCDTWCRTGG